METPKYLQVLWTYKWLLLFGIVVAAVAGFFAGFSVSGGEIYSRAQQSWLASTTVLMDSGRSTLYQSDIYAPTPTSAEAPAPEVVRQDLTDLARIYAYLASSAEIRDRVEAEIGPLDELESITAVSRTTQPTGNELFPGRLSLPVLDIVGVAATPNRAELISRTANEEFQAYIVEQQDAQELTEDIRVKLMTLEEREAVEGQGSNPAIPIVVAAGGTFLAFVALAYILYGIRTARRTSARRVRAIESAEQQL